MSTYSIEHAKSGRSKCKKCKEPIAKGDFRIGTHTDAGGDYDMTSWTHPKCFFLPRKLKSQGMDGESFVTDILRDDTDENILTLNAEKRQEIIADIDHVAPRGSAQKKANGSFKEGTVAHLKQMRDSMAEVAEPPAKKMKLSEQDKAKVDIFVHYEKASNDQLKDILRWNHQMVTGTKDILMARVIDGQMHGRLARCPLCIRGKLQIQDEAAKRVICKGFYDENIGVHESCSFTCPVEDAPREHPWFTEKPSEEEEAAMTAAADALKSGSKAVGAGSDDLISQLEEKAEALEWNLDTPKGIQKATQDMMDLCKEAGVDLPEGNTKMKIGSIVTGNQNLPPSEVVKLVVQEYGFVEQNEQAAEKKAAAVSSLCGHPANAEIVAVLLELSKAYFSSHNANAGVSYKKVAHAVSQLDFEITEENAKGLGKGKTKIDGIGKSSAEKIYEFVTTGKIEKLEEKRAEAA